MAAPVCTLLDGLAARVSEVDLTDRVLRTAHRSSRVRVAMILAGLALAAVAALLAAW